MPNDNLPPGKTVTGKPVKVLYIAGWGRSGSTLLARILGQIDGWVHTGELRTIWTDGLKPNGVCGCGTLVRECSVWQAVFELAFGGFENVDSQAMAHLRLTTEPRSQEILTTRFWPDRQRQLQARLQDYIQVLSRLYSAIQTVTNAQVIIDDSLHPGYAYTLGLVPNLEVYLVHVIRDARGCAYSWAKRIKRGLNSYTLKESAMGWSLRNGVIEGLRPLLKTRYLRLRYEDWIVNPQEQLKGVLELLGEPATALPPIAQDQLYLLPSHSVFGNPNRTQTGEVKLSLDEQWRQKLTRSEQGQVLFWTWPLLLKYGYLWS